MAAMARVRLVAVFALTLLLLLPAAPVVAGGATAVTSDCLHTGIRPRAIVLACADANWYARRLRWYRWGHAEARGRGVFHFNDCIPNCSAGHFHARRGRIELRHRQWCRGQHVHVFVDAVIVYDHPWQGQTRFTAGLGCPLERTPTLAAPITLGG